MTAPYEFDWQIDLRSSPEALWPLVADTNRFNRDTGLPPVRQMTGAAPGARRLFFHIFGVRIEWDEEPFEWVYPYRFGISRRYRRGPVARMDVQTELSPSPQGGTRLRYHVWAWPASPVGHPAIWIQIGLISRLTFLRVFERYDRALQQGGSFLDLGPVRSRFAPGGVQRLEAARPAVLRGPVDAGIFAQVDRMLHQADDLALQRIRPYQLADLWRTPRRSTLEVFLRAAQAGVFDLRWELLCPMCRGVAEAHASLGDVHNHSHCDYCNIDFDANLDRQVEVTFHPSRAVRPVDEHKQFCPSGPHTGPHLRVSERIRAGQERRIDTVLEAGQYVLQCDGMNGSLPVLVTPDGAVSFDVRLYGGEWPAGEQRLAPRVTLRVTNKLDAPALLKIERTAWRDDAATAADVTSLQVFRDLFAREALRAGEEIAIESVTLMFTDLRDSTRLYRQIGDARAFARVRQHFELLEAAIAAEGGAVVKTMGDAVMAVFRRPAPALQAYRAAFAAISALEGTPALALKVGIHIGPCIVVTLNERLDYFGSTVNIAARLPTYSQGGEAILSDEVRRDPEAAAWLAEHGGTTPFFEAELRGFDRPFRLWRLKGGQG